ncbi:hypothetical protein HFP72_05635 [Nocardiopsis sp. ARC36]
MTLSTANQPLVHTRSDLYESAVTSALIVALGLFAAVTFPAIREVRYGRSPVGPLGRAGRFLAVGAGAALVGWACVAALLALDAWQYAGPVPGLVHPLSHLTPFVVVLVGPAGAMALVAWTRSYTPLLLIALVVPTYGLYTITAFDTAQSVDRVVTRVQSLALMAVDPFPVHSPGVPVLVQLYAAYLGLAVLGLVALALAATGRRASRAAALGTALVLLAGAGGTAAHGATAYTWGSPCRTASCTAPTPSPAGRGRGSPTAPCPATSRGWSNGTRSSDPCWRPCRNPRPTTCPWCGRTARASTATRPASRRPGSWSTTCASPTGRGGAWTSWTGPPAPSSASPPSGSRCAGPTGSRACSWPRGWRGWTRSPETTTGGAGAGCSWGVLPLPAGPRSAARPPGTARGAGVRGPPGPLGGALLARGRTEELAGLLGIPLRGSPHESPAQRDWDRLFSGTDMAYHANPTPGPVCA